MALISPTDILYFTDFFILLVLVLWKKLTYQQQLVDVL